jgi:L,D-peptidoglycan transpeptidase YkuD (ErfK/YbiS/YcfS/YnhG family)
MIFSVQAVGDRASGDWAGSLGSLRLPDREARCALGRTGIRPAADKHEGDGATPAGLWFLREVLWRPDKISCPISRLRTRSIEFDDGWCDAPTDGAYNRPVRLPYGASAERMWRDDPLYDLIVVLGYNDAPVVAGAGSAIFMHVARPDYAATEGCIALALEDLISLVFVAAPGDALRVTPGD